MSVRRELDLAAAARLEDLLPHMREIVGEIRTGKVEAHAAIYEARRELSRIVVMVGAEIPKPSGHDWGVSDSPFVIPDGQEAGRCAAKDERGQRCVRFNFDGHGDNHRYEAAIKD
jgi:hypothetical protein